MKFFRTIALLVAAQTACAPSTAPDPKQIAREVRAGGFACTAAVELAIREATWIDAFYEKYRAEIDELVSSAVTDESGYMRNDFFLGSDSLHFSAQWSDESIELVSGAHSYKASRKYENFGQSIEVALDEAYFVRSPVRRIHTSPDSEAYVDGDFTCKTPDLEFFRLQSFQQSVSPTMVSFYARKGNEERSLFATAVESHESYDGGAMFFSGTACFENDCVGMARFTETGYTHDELSAGMTPPFYIPPFLEKVFR